MSPLRNKTRTQNEKREGGGVEDALNGQQRFQGKLRMLKTKDDLKKKKKKNTSGYKRGRTAGVTLNL